MSVFVFRAIIFNRLITAAFASATLDVLVDASASFSVAIQQLLEMLQSDPSPAELAEKTIDYPETKRAYFKSLRKPYLIAGRNVRGILMGLAETVAKMTFLEQEDIGIPR